MSIYFSLTQFKKAEIVVNMLEGSQNNGWNFTIVEAKRNDFA